MNLRRRYVLGPCHSLRVKRGVSRFLGSHVRADLGSNGCRKFTGGRSWLVQKSGRTGTRPRSVLTWCHLPCWHGNTAGLCRRRPDGVACGRSHIASKNGTARAKAMNRRRRYVLGRAVPPDKRSIRRFSDVHTLDRTMDRMDVRNSRAEWVPLTYFGSGPARPVWMTQPFVRSAADGKEARCPGGRPANLLFQCYRSQNISPVDLALGHTLGN
jgi:hypothetical protein